MKKIIILALALSATFANAQTLTQAVNKFSGTEITSSGEIGIGVMSEKQKTIALSSLLKLNPSQIKYDGLTSEINKRQ